MKYGLVLRAYAPFKRFGIAFAGDARGPTTSPDVTSRIKAWVVFDPIAGTVEDPRAKSDASKYVAVISHRATEAPMTRITRESAGSGWVNFQLHASGANPLVAKSPPIDMHVSISANVSRDCLNINSQLNGDRFPNCEVIVQDEGGGRRMLMSFETDGSADVGPLRLFGDARRGMNAICRSFPIDGAGRFR